MKDILLFFLFTNLIFSQDISERYIDSIITLPNKNHYSDYKKMLRKINMMPTEHSLDWFNYIALRVKGNDSLVLYNTSYHLSTLMRFGKNKQALQLCSENIKLAKSRQWPYFMYQNYQIRANIFQNLSKLDSMAYYINEAERIVMKNKSELGHHMARIYQQRSQLEQSKGNTVKEDEFMEKIAEVVDAYPNKNMAYNLSLIVYYFKQKKDYQKHAYYSQKLREYYIKRDGLATPKSHPSISAMLEMDNTEEQISELKQIIVSNDSMGYNFYSIQMLNVLSRKLMEQKRYSEAIVYINKSLSKNSEDINLYSKLISYQNLYSCYYDTGDYKMATDALNNLIKVQNTIRNRKSLDKISELEVQFDTEKKEANLKLLQQENENQSLKAKQYSIIAIGGFLIASLFAFFGYKNRKKNNILAKQKVLLENALDEKNTLLKEVHHRVKNSFQIVSSLLYLQSESMDDDEAKLAIKEAENRVRSMVLVHQKLYNKDELVGINTKEYIHDLVTDIFESHKFKNKKINYNLNIEPMVLDIETITPIGLILNELIINTLKHAFDEVTEAGIINVNFKKQNEQLILKVSDNGKGFEGEPSTSSFGLKLIKALSKKLKATLNYNSSMNEGTEALLGITKFNIIT